MISVRFCLCWCLLFTLASSLRAQLLVHSRLPILKIAANHADLTRYSRQETVLQLFDSATDSLNRLTDGAQLTSAVGIRLRGSSSLGLFPKTGYRLELHGSAGQDRSVAVLGMPEEEDWILHGPYSDKSLIRNAFAYSLAGDLMRYAPRGRFVEFLLNDDYRGVYLLVESIKRDDNRVDIAKLKSDETEGEDLSGGYILKIDKGTNENWSHNPLFTLAPHRYDFGGSAETPLFYHYPKPRNIVPEQRAYIKQWMQDFENTLASPAFDDPVNGFWSKIDVESFINYFLINEITRNVDAYRLSTYMYKERDRKGGRLSMGPVWDFNLGFDNGQYCTELTVGGWIYRFPEYCPSDLFQPPFW